MRRELLFSLTRKDFDVQTFRSGGKGGQNQNKVETGVRIIHRDSGATGESREERSQLLNKRIAFKRLVNTPVFKIWHKRKCAEVSMNLAEINRRVDDAMRNENLVIETYVP